MLKIQDFPGQRQSCAVNNLTQPIQTYRRLHRVKMDLANASEVAGSIRRCSVQRDHCSSKFFAFKTNHKASASVNHKPNRREIPKKWFQMGFEPIHTTNLEHTRFWGHSVSKAITCKTKLQRRFDRWKLSNFMISTFCAVQALYKQYIDINKISSSIQSSMTQTNLQQALSLHSRDVGSSGVPWRIQHFFINLHKFS